MSLKPLGQPCKPVLDPLIHKHDTKKTFIIHKFEKGIVMFFPIPTAIVDLNKILVCCYNEDNIRSDAYLAEEYNRKIPIDDLKDTFGEYYGSYEFFNSKAVRLLSRTGCFEW